MGPCRVLRFRLADQELEHERRSGRAERGHREPGCEEGQIPVREERLVHRPGREEDVMPVLETPIRDAPPDPRQGADARLDAEALALFKQVFLQALGWSNPETPLIE